MKFLFSLCLSNALALKVESCTKSKISFQKPSVFKAVDAVLHKCCSPRSKRGSINSEECTEQKNASQECPQNCECSNDCFCFQETDEEKIRYWDCQHVFHASCAQKWAKENPEKGCPYCKQTKRRNIYGSKDGVPLCGCGEKMKFGNDMAKGLTPMMDEIRWERRWEQPEPQEYGCEHVVWACHLCASQGLEASDLKRSHELHWVCEHCSFYLCEECGQHHSLPNHATAAHCRPCQ